jgi:hypothetical protein
MASAAVLPISGRASKASLEYSKPKPATVDQAARDFLALKLQQNNLEDQIERARGYLLAIVDKFGAVPPKAEKSKRLSGELYEVTASYGTTTSVDTAGAEQLLLTLIDAGMEKKTATALFESFFVFQPKYALAPTALKAIAGKLPKGAPRNLRALFAKAVTTKPKTPTLNVAER